MKFALQKYSINFYFLCSILITFIDSANAQTPSGFNLVAYEGFNYTAGSSLLNANGGSGWSTAWSKAYQDRYLKTATTGITYTGLSTQGLKAEFDSACYGTCNEIAALGRLFPLQNEGVTYIQFISVFEASAGFGTPGIRLSDGGVGTGVIGAHTGSFMSICSPSTILSSSTASLSAQNFVVVRVDYNLNKTEMWVNPDLSTFNYSNPPSSDASATGFAPAFDRFDIFIRSGSIDEIAIFSQISPPTSISGTTVICAGDSTTLTASGGTTNSNTVDTWYEGACGGDAFHEGFDTQPTNTVATTVNSNLNGILNVTSTTDDAMIDMFNLGNFNPLVYKYINFRYRVVSGTAVAAQIFFLNGSMILADGSKYLDTPLISDNSWHIATIDMSTHELWAIGGNITGIRFDYNVASGVTMDLDFIELSAAPIVETGSSITVTPSTTTTYYANRKGYTVNTTCVSQVVTVNPLPQPLSITNSLCAATGLDWVTWNNVTATTATGTMNGIGVTVTQSNPGLGTTPSMFDYATFPAQYNVPNGTTILNEKAGTFTITFAKPINNPQVAFSSIGNPSTTVGITTSVPYSVIWQGPGMTYPTSTTMTGTEGFTIISFPGLHSAITMTYDTDEYYANIAFGAENANCSDPIICQGTPITLTASGGFAYQWSPSTGLSATNTASVIATPSVTTTYSVIDTSNACAVASTVTVTVSNQAPILSNAVSGTQYFASNSAITPIVITNSGGAVTTGGYSVAPALPTGLILDSNGMISGTPTVTSPITTYTITGSNGCGYSTTAVTLATGIAATISNFNNINKMYHDGSFTIGTPTSNSTGAFSYTSSNTAVATISGTTVTILGAGTSTITANQAADASYASGSATALLTVNTVEVLTVNGKISNNSSNYVNSTGKKGGNTGLTRFGEIKTTKTPPLVIGDSYGGGIVAYILQVGDSGYDPDVQHGLIAAASDQSNRIWSNGVDVTTGATGTAIGTGLANTNTIITIQGTTATDYAAGLARAYVGGGYNDWYLPSKYELNLLYLQKTAVGGFAYTHYWSSTESSNTYACGQNFNNGHQVITLKNIVYKVRAVRAF